MHHERGSDVTPLTDGAVVHVKVDFKSQRLLFWVNGTLAGKKKEREKRKKKK
jgi:hypothetical protein